VRQQNMKEYTGEKKISQKKKRERGKKMICEFPESRGEKTVVRVENVGSKNRPTAHRKERDAASRKKKTGFVAARGK